MELVEDQHRFRRSGLDDVDIGLPHIAANAFERCGSLRPEELEGFQQCWLTGTAAEVTPVGQIGDYNFEVGALTRDISEGYEELVRE